MQNPKHQKDITWAHIEMVESLTRAMSEAGLKTYFSPQALREMSVERLVDMCAHLGIRFEFHPTKRVE